MNPDPVPAPGAAEPLVLLPGIGCDARLFLPLLVTLSHERAIQVVPVHSAPAVADLADAVLAAAPLRFALMGQGLGGVVALEVLRRAPDRVHRLAVSGSDPLAEMPQAAATREARIVAAQAGRLADALSQEVPAAALAPGPGRLTVQRMLSDMGQDLGPAAYVRQARALQRRPDQQKTLRRALHPTLVLCGAHDTVVPPRRQEFMAQMMPRARLVTLDDAGHLAPLESPGACLAALDDWFALPSALR